MSNLYFGITRYGYDICSEISDMACFSLNLKTAVDFNAEARCASNEMHLRRSRQVTRGHRPSPVGGASGCVVGLSERSEPEGPQGAARRKVTQRDPAKSTYCPSAKSIPTVITPRCFLWGQQL